MFCLCVQIIDSIEYTNETWQLAWLRFTIEKGNDRLRLETVAVFDAASQVCYLYNRDIGKMCLNQRKYYKQFIQFRYTEDEQNMRLAPFVTTAGTKCFL